MQTWSLDFRRGAAMVDVQRFARMIGAIGASDPNELAQAMLLSIRDAAAVDNCAIYIFKENCRPRFLSYASLGDSRITHLIGGAYAREFHRRDPVQQAFDATLHRCGERIMARQLSEEILDEEYRRVCYANVGNVDRVSIVSQNAPDSRIVVSLYRHKRSGTFSAAELERLLGVAPVITEVTQRHVALVRAPAEEIEERASDQLQRLCPTLSERERAVLARMAQGMTYDGIAADLGVKPTSVITYRNRAFARLRIRTRHELFRALLRQRPAMAPVGSEGQPPAGRSTAGFTTLAGAPAA